MQRSTEQLTRCSTGTLEEEIVDKTGNALTTQTVSEKIMSVCRNTIRWIVLADAFLAVSVLALLGIVEFGVIPHQRIGFFCNDPKISFKFTGDTIPIGLLIAGSIVIPIVVMWIAEYTCHSADSYDLERSNPSRKRQVWIWYGHYTVGFVILTFICDIMKILIGEPRPHFLDTCQPREANNCTDQYIGVYTCTNTVDSDWFVSDSSKSFPSGHSALSLYTTIFIVAFADGIIAGRLGFRIVAYRFSILQTWYLQSRLPNRTLLLRPWLQCAMCLWAVACSLTRIGDNRHHWWDVLAGDVLGAIFGVFVVMAPCRKFHLDHGPTPSRALCEPTENGQPFNDKRHQSIKKLLSNTSVEIPEGRELRDISAPWKE